MHCTGYGKEVCRCLGSVARVKGTELTPRHPLMRELNRLCKEERLPAHCYAVYYLTKEADRAEIITSPASGTPESYALIWHGGRFTIMDVYEIHLWKPKAEVVSKIDIVPGKRADVQLYSNEPGDIDIIIERFKSLGFKEFETEEFHDMVCTQDSFRPSPRERLAVKLEEKHAPLYRDLELERGIEMGVDEAGEILKEYTHYGIIVDGILASIAARYVTTPVLHILGGVFTRKGYRGRGYAKAATSALTREVVSTGAYACLHVEADYDVAIGMYGELGYRIIRTRPWVFAYP